MLGKTALPFIPGLTAGLAPTSDLMSLGSSPKGLSFRINIKWERFMTFISLVLILLAPLVAWPPRPEWIQPVVP